MQPSNVELTYLIIITFPSRLLLAVGDILPSKLPNHHHVVAVRVSTLNLSALRRRKARKMVGLADVPVDKMSRGDETGSADEKAVTANVEDNRPMRLQAPEFIRNLTPEEREHLEKRLKRKIDIRLLPAIIIMYIMNYIDRCVLLMDRTDVMWRLMGTPLGTTSPLRGWPGWNGISS
jgi:hypothetical protein